MKEPDDELITCEERRMLAKFLTLAAGQLLMTFFEGIGGVAGRSKGLGGNIRPVLDIVNLRYL